MKEIQKKNGAVWNSESTSLLLKCLVSEHPQDLLQIREIRLSKNWGPKHILIYHYVCLDKARNGSIKHVCGPADVSYLVRFTMDVSYLVGFTPIEITIVLYPLFFHGCELCVYPRFGRTKIIGHVAVAHSIPCCETIKICRRYETQI